MMRVVSLQRPVVYGGLLMLLWAAARVQVLPASLSLDCAVVVTVLLPAYYSCLQPVTRRHTRRG
jgi:integral membrane sensor domain MASE1